jgi:hypothetical protein
MPVFYGGAENSERTAQPPWPTLRLAVYWRSLTEAGLPFSKCVVCVPPRMSERAFSGAARGQEGVRDLHGFPGGALAGRQGTVRPRLGRVVALRYCSLTFHTRFASMHVFCLVALFLKRRPFFLKLPNPPPRPSWAASVRSGSRTVRARSGSIPALSVSHSKSFLWRCRVGARGA